MATRSSAITSQVVGDGELAGRSLGYVWNPNSLAYEVATAGGGGGGAVTIADGADVAQGATTDAEAAAGNGSVVAILKRIRTLLGGTIAVSGTFYQGTQPVSAASLPLPTGAATETTLGNVKAKTDNLDVALSTVAKDATLTGGTTKAIARGGAKGATTAADVTSTAEGADHNAIDVQLYHGGTAKDPTAIRALTNADVVKAQLQDNAGTAVTVGQKVMASSLPIVIASDQSAVPVTAPTLTKGTQGANGLSVQELKDAGRVNIMWTLEFSPAAVAEALMTMTESRDGAAVTTFTTKVVTTGKRLRVTSWTIVVENTLGVNPKRGKLRMKFNTAGAVTTASPLQANLIASVATAVNTVGQVALDDFPDGVEYLGDGTKQIGFTLEFPDWVAAAQTGKVYVTIFAFEY